ncbi:hypothetical protein B5E60_05810 [Alistipes sp. An116]|nr:hypothetical protein B5E60_05810 [Alistipes sp. An116]
MSEGVNEKSPLLTFVNNGLRSLLSGDHHTRDEAHSLFTSVNGCHHQACMLKLRSIFFIELAFRKYKGSEREKQIFYELFLIPRIYKGLQNEIAS